MVSLHRDAAAYSQAVELLANGSPAIRRAAAEALGRMGNRAAVPHLLRAAGSANDRILKHSITFALIELANPVAILASASGDKPPGTLAAALVAMDQMPDGGLRSTQVIPLLNASDATLRDTARWLVSRHTEWGGELRDWFRQQLIGLADNEPTNEVDGVEALQAMLVEFAVHPAVQQLLAETLEGNDSSTRAKQVSLRAIARAPLAKTPAAWRVSLAGMIRGGDQVPRVLSAVRELPLVAAADDPLNAALLTFADSVTNSIEDRVLALAVVARSLKEVTESQFTLLLDVVAMESSAGARSAAVDALSNAPLTPDQLERLCTTIESAGPLELNRLLTPYSGSADERLGMKLLASLEASPALPSLRIDILRTSLAKHGPNVHKGIDALEMQLNVDAASQRKRIEELLPQMAKGDVARGHAVFYSSKAACSACHVLGNAGGTVGPELTRIGEARTERDLLESILYPNLSFVRSYEPVSVVTVDGRTINGTIRDETDKEYILATGPDQEVRVSRDDVEQIEPSTVSIMPGGLDGQLTVQQLADLVAFLKNASGQ
jgi:putative heme-binding domain-containing protein